MKRTLLVAALLFTTALAFIPASDAKTVCVGKPGSVQACAGDSDQGTCAAAGFGLQGAYACVGGDGGGTRVCSSLYVNHVGNCPTDLVGTLVGP